jgi:transcriptional regulator with XRE-family HTH domain
MIKEFGETIKNARLAKDLSLRDLAELTGLDHSYIGRLEKNSSTPSRETVTKLAKALNIPENELMVIAGYIEAEDKELKEKILEVLEKNKKERLLRGGEAIRKITDTPSPSLDDELTQIMRDLGPDVTLQFYDLKGMSQEEKEQLKIFLQGLKARRKEQKKD